MSDFFKTWWMILRSISSVNTFFPDDELFLEGDSLGYGSGLTSGFSVEDPALGILRDCSLINDQLECMMKLASGPGRLTWAACSKIVLFDG